MLASLSDDLLLQADADTGYGKYGQRKFYGQGFENAGVAAVMIEDQSLAKKMRSFGRKICDTCRGDGSKIKSAVDAKRDPDFIIKARTDAAGPLGINAAIDRLNAYAEAGATLLFADALLSEADIINVVSNVPKPLAVNMGLGLLTRGTTPLIHPKRLQEIGVSMVSYPRLMSTSAVKGMSNAMVAFSQMLESEQTTENQIFLCHLKSITN